MRCVWVLLGVQTHIFTLHPYLRVFIIAKTKCAKSENETSKTSLFSLTFSLLIFGLCNSFQCLKDWKELEF